HRQEAIAVEVARALTKCGFETEADRVRQVIDALRVDATHEVHQDWIVTNNGPVEAAGTVLQRVLQGVVKTGLGRNTTRKLRQVLEAELKAGAFAGGPQNDIEFFSSLLNALGVPPEVAVDVAGKLGT